jgi:hypothetical protein
MNAITRKIIDHKLPSVFTGDALKRLEPDDPTRRSLLADALHSGDLIRIYHDIYTLGDDHREDVVNDYLLANLIKPGSYLSLEMALRNVNWIPEHVFAHTSVTSGAPCEIRTEFGRFEYTYLPQKNYFAGVRQVHYGDETHWQAKPLKALADYVYRMGYDWDTLEPLTESLRIEEDDLATLTAADFDEVQGNYGVHNVEHFLTGIRKELAV